MLPRRFALVRHVDYTGVAGTGVIAYGVAFDDGQVVLRWSSTHRATSMLDSVEDLIAVHGHGEATSIEWIDPPPGQTDEAPQVGGRRARRPAADEVTSQPDATSNEGAGGQSAAQARQAEADPSSDVATDQHGVVDPQDGPVASLAASTSPAEAKSEAATPSRAANAAPAEAAQPDATMPPRAAEPEAATTSRTAKAAPAEVPVLASENAAPDPRDDAGSGLVSSAGGDVPLRVPDDRAPAADITPAQHAGDMLPAAASSNGNGTAHVAQNGADAAGPPSAGRTYLEQTYGVGNGSRPPRPRTFADVSELRRSARDRDAEVLPLPLPTASDDALPLPTASQDDEHRPAEHALIATQPMKNLSRPRRAERRPDSPRSIFDEAEEPRRPDLRLASSNNGRGQEHTDSEEPDRAMTRREQFQGFFATGHQHVETVTGLLDLPAGLTRRGRDDQHEIIEPERARSGRNGRHRQGD